MKATCGAGLFGMSTVNLQIVKYTYCQNVVAVLWGYNSQLELYHNYLHNPELLAGSSHVVQIHYVLVSRKWRNQDVHKNLKTAHVQRAQPQLVVNAACCARSTTLSTDFTCKSWLKVTNRTCF